jgi:hypothetical protein
MTTSSVLDKISEGRKQFKIVPAAYSACRDSDRDTIKTVVGPIETAADGVKIRRISYTGFGKRVIYRDSGAITEDGRIREIKRDGTLGREWQENYITRILQNLIEA